MYQNFTSQDFSRLDESDDSNFYKVPRLVVHIDDVAIATLRNVFRRYIPIHSRLLDLMSSYRSHLPEEIHYREVMGLGMNSDEMRKNPQLTRHIIQDLNRNPILPFDNKSFDAVFITVSIQYLTQPITIFREIARILESDGVFIVAFSNRMFPTKAVRIWREGSDEDHVALVRRYYELAGSYIQIDVERFVDTTSPWFRKKHDPLFVVIGRRQTR